ncbi:hypothetical protein NBRC116602_29590 [Hyphomicrobiales bacterium 4NK60-0047b]
MSEPKTPTSQETKPAREIDEQTQKHLDRFLQGREIWNKWARKKLEDKKKLLNSGKWEVDNVLVLTGDKAGKNYTKSSNPETQEWLEECLVDFSNFIFSKKKFVIPRFQNNIDQAKKINPSFRENFIEQGYIDFSNYIFPSDLDFSNTHFCFPTSMNGASYHGLVNFSNCRFYERSHFFNVAFNKQAHFENAKFFKEIIFDEFKFDKFVFLNEVKFFDDVKFSNGIFNDFVDFADVIFEGSSNFGETKFNRNSNFTKSKFHKEVLFNLAEFNGYTAFEDVNFKSNASFLAIKSTSHFSLESCKFNSGIPNFLQANFAESPRLDNIELLPAPLYENYPFPLKKIQSSLKRQRYWWNLQYRAYLMRLFWRSVYKLTPSNYRKLYHKGEILKHIWNKFTNKRLNPDEEAHYRALKRLAIQAHDHENEMKFFAGEIRSRRHITDFFFPWKKGIASSMRYWAGVFYEAFSDFGRSFIRPTLWWFACLWLFANLTLSGAGLVDTTKCHNSQLTPKQAAYTIGLKNSLLILGLTKTNIVKQAELCLYGLNKNGTNKNGDSENKPKPYDPKIKRTYQAKSTKADTTKTDIPFKAAVQGIAHSLLSLLFIFLLLLAIRNQFKIK